MTVPLPPSPQLSQFDVLRRRVVLRTPFTVERLPLLSRLHAAAFRQRRRLSRRLVGKPAKRLFRLLRAAGLAGTGTVRLALPEGPRRIAFDARNTQFGALYLPQSLPVYEPETLALLDLLVADEGVFLDVGANWGWYAVLVASRPGFHGEVHAFEPYPPTFADLAAVVRQAGLGRRVHCHELALAAQAGSSSMALSDGIQSGLARLGEAGGVAVRTAPLDAIGLPPPDVIKIDAEDHELDVLRGADATIAAARPFVVFENWLHRANPALTLDPLQWFAARGYRFFHAGWVAGAADCVLAKPAPAADGSAELALLPFLAASRFMLPDQLNVLAVPAERMAELRRRITGQTA